LNKRDIIGTILGVLLIITLFMIWYPNIYDSWCLLHPTSDVIISNEYGITKGCMTVADDSTEIPKIQKLFRENNPNRILISILNIDKDNKVTYTTNDGSDLRHPIFAGFYNKHGVILLYMDRSELKK